LKRRGVNARALPHRCYDACHLKLTRLGGRFVCGSTGKARNRAKREIFGLRPAGAGWIFRASRGSADRSLGKSSAFKETAALP